MKVLIFGKSKLSPRELAAVEYRRGSGGVLKTPLGLFVLILQPDSHKRDATVLSIIMGGS